MSTDLRISELNAMNVADVQHGTDVIGIEDITAVQTKKITRQTLLHLLDNDELRFGNAVGGDATLTYDGTDLVLNPKATGAGALKIQGDTDVTGNISVSGTNRFELGGAGSDTFWREGAPDRAELFVGGVQQISATIAQIILNLPVAVIDANSQVSLFTSRIDTGVTGNTVSNLSHRGDDTADTNVLYAQTKTVIRDATPGSINGSYQVRVAENDLSNTSDKTLYMEWHGLNADIDVLKDLDMAADIKLNANSLLTTNFDITESTLFVQTGLLFKKANAGVGYVGFAPNATGNTGIFIYRTSTTATNTEFLAITADRTAANTFEIVSNKEGTGTVRPIIIKTGGTTHFTFNTDGTNTINASSTFNAGAIFAGDLTMNDGKNFNLNTANGTKFGLATNQKIGFWNTLPIIQPLHIVDADGTLADITTKFNTLLAQHASMGLQAAS